MKKRFMALCIVSAMLLTAWSAAMTANAAENGNELSAAVTEIESCSQGDLEYKIESDNTVTIRKYKGKDTAFIIPSTIENKPVRTIGAGAFELRATLTSVTIPESVTEIRSNAFANCKKLEKVNIPSQVTVINSSAFTYCESLESIAIPEGVERINASAFRYCKSLKSITIPGSVKTIGDNAFEYCTSLKEAKLCDGIEQLLVGTFKNCSSLRSIYIPTSVKELGTSSFGGCANLRGIGIANDSVAYNAEFSIFQNCPKLTLYANENSKTQNYAEKYDIPFKPLSEFEKEMNYGKAGDLDDDDIVTAADALLVLRHSVGLEYFTAREIALANVDGDDSITSLDSLAILRYSVGYADSGMKFD
ncbi:MAG: leucine-rich repeat protein [Clostridia bacterium]|nr:leucine-rich repeat protein [Clostridia bacterium]